jgi:oligosaccharide reducing-end xylanase
MKKEMTILARILMSSLLIAVLVFEGQETCAQTITSNQTGTSNGYYFSFWNQGGGSISMNIVSKGHYTTSWSNVTDFTCGLGWNPGTADRVVNYTGSFNGGSNGFLALYGWTKNSLIEYYVCENHGSWTPPGNTSDIKNHGTFTSDGGTYTIYTATRTNEPSIIGTATFQQYWSVRSQTRSSGTITFANHVAAWQKAGMSMGSTYDYQIMLTEGYMSSGSSDITLTEGSSCTTVAPTTTLSINYEVGDLATKLTATGTSLKWYADNTTTTALSTAPTPSTATSGVTKYYVSQTLNGCEGPRAEITVTVTQTYKIYKVASPVTIDGTIDDVWTNGNVMPMNATKLLSGTVTNSADLSGYGKLLWDDTYLYALAVVTDDKKVNDSQNSYDDDAVEFYIDGNDVKATTYDANDVQYTFGWNDGTTIGTIPTNFTTAGVVYSAVSTSTGYIVEAKIPWSNVQSSPMADKLVGIDFMINDDDDGGTRDGKLSWNSATDDAYENASLFGTGKLYSQQVVTGLDGFAVDAFSLFPNPATTELHVTGLSSVFDYSVLDNSGRLILKGQSTEKIEISELEAGIYMVRIVADGRTVTKKIVKK